MPPLTDNPALPVGSRILVTGANGYIASHIVNILLELGYQVRGTVRAPKPWLDELFRTRHGEDRFESVVWSHLHDAEGLERVMQGVSGVIHVATDVSFSDDPTLIDRAVASTQLLLQTAASNRSITRVVLTSSSYAALLPRPNQPGIIVTQETWNDQAITQSHDPSTPASQKPTVIYAASKTASERQAWQWMRAHNPGFIFNTVLPGTCFGPILHPAIPGSTMGFIRALQEGNPFPLSAIPPQWFVNVEDAARLHVIGLLDREVVSERLFAFAAPFNWTDVLRILHQRAADEPHRYSARKLPAIPVAEARDLSAVVAARRAEELLVKDWERERGFVGLQESVGCLD